MVQVAYLGLGHHKFCLHSEGTALMVPKSTKSQQEGALISAALTGSTDLGLTVRQHGARNTALHSSKLDFGQITSKRDSPPLKQGGGLGDGAAG